MEHRRIAQNQVRRQRPREALDLDDVIYGIHAVEEALAAGEVLRKIHVGDDRKRDPAMRVLLERARENDITIRFENRGFFAQFPYKAHQGVVAFGAPFGYVAIDEAISMRKGDDPRLIVVLDHITDPHNAGAIVRSAECAGASAIVLSERRSAGVNATVRKASAGATEHIAIARVSNVAGALRTLKKAGFWISGAALGTGSQPYTAIDFRGDVALVIGAEGDGLSSVAAKECDHLATIPMLGEVDSLNASVAAGVLLFEVRRQRTLASSGDQG